MVLKTIVYYDASGQQEGTSGTLAVMGVVATEDAWTSLEREWEGVLTEFHVPYFSEAECAHSVGAFKSWKGKEEQRETFIQLLGCTSRCHGRTFGSCCVCWCEA